MKTLASRSEKCTSPQIHRRWCTTPVGSQTLEDTQVTWPDTLQTKSPMGMSQEHGTATASIRTSTQLQFRVSPGGSRRLFLWLSRLGLGSSVVKAECQGGQ